MITNSEQMTISEPSWCQICDKGNHSVSECPKFLDASTEQRHKGISEQRRYFACMRRNHRMASCNNKMRCCNGKRKNADGFQQGGTRQKCPRLDSFRTNTNLPSSAANLATRTSPMVKQDRNANPYQWSRAAHPIKSESQERYEHSRI